MAYDSRRGPRYTNTFKDQHGDYLTMVTPRDVPKIWRAIERSDCDWYTGGPGSSYQEIRDSVNADNGLREEHPKSLTGAVIFEHTSQNWDYYQRDSQPRAETDDYHKPFGRPSTRHGIPQTVARNLYQDDLTKNKWQPYEDRALARLSQMNPYTCNDPRVHPRHVWEARAARMREIKDTRQWPNDRIYTRDFCSSHWYRLEEERM